ncbi:type 4a pilus biogenesis protein PilO [Arenimonas sp.]|jgi:type IV pilus assembly protein PilO|uniref:type 4a pilus biogenesis protein PilO n=1 Tax=Arenimonas sp. TaxID=1872635 RepID=UPI0037C06D95
MKNINLSDIDFKSSGSWPKELKYAVCIFLVILILLGAWFFMIKDKRDEMLRLESDETALRADFENKQARASNLEPLKQQLVQMELILQQMLRQLPSKNEMPDLIVDVSQEALQSGITNELFQPGPETPREFYAEKPISIRMVGNYHQFGAFMSGVASLPRVVIMTMHDISLKPRGTNNELLEMAGTIKTYRYLDPNEQAAAPVEGGAP